MLWVHGKLPFDISDTSGLEQRARRRPNAGESGSPRIFSLQAIPGPNRIEEDLPGIIRLISPGGMVLEERLSRAFSMVLYPNMRPQEQIFSLQTLEGGRIFESSSHVVRLAYAGEIARRAASGEKISDGAREKAREMRIVTPVTGAVVLENADQYAEHGLDPSSDTRSVPTIPEPEEYALMAVVCALLALTYFRGRACRRP